METKSKLDFFEYNDEQYINELPVEWYILNMYFNNTDARSIDWVVDPLIEAGLHLKRCLQTGG